MADRWPIGAFGDEIAPGLEDDNVVDLGPERLDRAAALLRAADISVSAVASPVGKADVEGDFDAEVSRLRAAMDAAHRLQTKLIRVFSFFVPEGRHAEFRDEVLRRMSTFAKEAASQDVVLVHENESYVYGDDAEHCRDLVESVGSPALQIAFDPANFVQVGVRPFDEAWPLLAQHVVHFHVKDAVGVARNGMAPYPARAPELQLMASVRPAGEGEGQFPELLQALDRRDYRGFLVIEPHLQERLHEIEAAERFAIALAALRGMLAGMVAKPIQGH